MSLNLVEASIAELQNALQSGTVSSTELVAKYLVRISTFDARGLCLNSIAILNPRVFDEAIASDARRAAGTLLGPLDGIPYTLKDSMKYQGMTCASGSPAFVGLLAKDDSFVAQQLRAAGCICIGRTNTPPMMASGMHRGAYGRAESPYNQEYLTAAFSSGSSNGSATSTAASFAAFGLGSETVSSGRSPASNNGLIAYTPSRTVISPRGCWPLYPTCDVLVPHTRSVADMLAILPVLTKADVTNDEDFWRQQTHVPVRPVDRPTYAELVGNAENIFKSKRIAVPRMYIGLSDPKAKPTVVSEEVKALWYRAKADLEALGATVVDTDFPLVSNYEDDTVSGHTNNVVGFTPDWNSKERGELVAYLWDDFLKSNGHPGLGAVDGTQIFPVRPDGYFPDQFLEHKNFMNYTDLVEIARQRSGKSIWEIDGLSQALPALEAQRKRDLEDWMTAHDLDFVVFPSAGDVGSSDVDTNLDSARHALQNGVKYSNGNRAIRHMGVPTTSVSMGVLQTSRMPVNLTFAGGHGSDARLLSAAYAFEQRTKRRVAPPLTPPLETDLIPGGKNVGKGYQMPLVMRDVTAMRVAERRIRVDGWVEPGRAVNVEVYVDGKAQPAVLTSGDGAWSVTADFTPFEPPKPLYGGVGTVVDKVVVVVLARSLMEKAVTGSLVLLDQKAPIHE